MILKQFKAVVKPFRVQAEFWALLKSLQSDFFPQYVRSASEMYP